MRMRGLYDIDRRRRAEALLPAGPAHTGAITEMGGVHQNARTFGHAYRTVPTLPGGGNARSTIHQISHLLFLLVD